MPLFDQTRSARLQLRLREMPERPGVYLHKNAEGEVIYVGKARNLRSRVAAYVVGKAARDNKTTTLIHEIDAIDFVETNNEVEAILLENNLIKTHQPRYNVLLRDDKSYPYIKVTYSEQFPRVTFTRRIGKDRRDLYFGPFFAGTARRVLKLVQDQFKLRSCDLVIEEGKNAIARPCIYYDMHQCLAPCVVGYTTRPAYVQMVDDVVLFLSGKTKELQATLKGRMYGAAESESFEVATYYRDLIRTIERIQSEQQVASAAGEDVDAWGFYEANGNVAIQVFILRDGNLVDRRELFWENVVGFDAPYFLSEVLQRYYTDNLFIPSEIHLEVEIPEAELIEEWLGSKRGRKTTLRKPQRGKGRDRLELATKNARISHESRFRNSQQNRLRDAALALGAALSTETPIRSIESFDISNIQGSDSVAGMIAFTDGRFDKKNYRIFNIKTVEGADDFRSMAEAVERRYKRLRDDEKPLPDVILIDGGRGQLNAALGALRKLGIDGVTIAGLAKREEEIYLPHVEEPLQLDRHDPALQLLQMIRDETHRFAVSSHRRRRSKRTLTSELDELSGVGQKRRRLLLEHFGSVSAVRQASQHDLAKVLGPRVAERIYQELHSRV